MKNAMTNGITVLIFSLLTVVKVYGQMNPLSWFENLQQYYKFLNLISWKKSIYFTQTIVQVGYTRREWPSMRR